MDFGQLFRLRYIERHIEAGHVADEMFVLHVMRRYGRERHEALAEIKEAQKHLRYQQMSRDYYQRNRDRLIVDSENKRCAKLGIAGIITLDGWLAVCERHKYACARCGAAIPLTIDHIRPISKGGTNWIGNIQPLCKPCNSRKSNSYDEVYEGGVL